MLTSLTVLVGMAVSLAFGVAATLCPAAGALLASTITQATMVAGNGLGAISTAIHLPAHRRGTPRAASPAWV